MKNSKFILLGVVALIIFCLDRFLKNLFFGGVNFTLIKGWLEFSAVGNQGIALGIPFLNWVFYIIITPLLLILVYILVKALKNKDLFGFTALALVILGAVSNLIDRVRWGHVLDYIHFWQWSVFNLADIMIIAAVLAYFIKVISKKKALTDK